MNIMPQVVHDYLQEKKNWNAFVSKKQYQSSYDTMSFMMMLPMLMIVMILSMALIQKKILPISSSTLGFIMVGLFIALVGAWIALSRPSKKEKAEANAKYAKLEQLENFAKAWVDDESNLKAVINEIEDNYQANKDIEIKILSLKAKTMEKSYSDVFNELRNLNELIQTIEKQKHLANEFDNKTELTISA